MSQRYSQHVSHQTQCLLTSFVSRKSFEQQCGGCRLVPLLFRALGWLLGKLSLFPHFAGSADRGACWIYRSPALPPSTLLPVPCCCCAIPLLGLPSCDAHAHGFWVMQLLNIVVSCNCTSVRLRECASDPLRPLASPLFPITDVSYSYGLRTCAAMRCPFASNVSRKHKLELSKQLLACSGVSN